MKRRKLQKKKDAHIETMTVTHANGCYAELHENGNIEFYNSGGELIARTRSCGARKSEELLKIIEGMPSFVEGIRRKMEESESNE